MNPYRDRPQGAFPRPDGRTLFRLWAPRPAEIRLIIDGNDPVEMRPTRDGFFEVELEAPPGTRYLYLVDDDRIPDPASRFQPEDVHGWSEVVSHDFSWSDGAWRGLRLQDVVLYELHVGTFTPASTFDAIIPRLGELRALGIRMIELMPVAEFPGHRNWGYDGVLPYAAESSYGGPEGLRRLVDAAHREGMGVCLDVVYNHLGPEGNYLERFGPYFTDAYRTPWGSAINFDGPESDPVREFFTANALMWIEQYHVDALRLDAVHAIHDESAYPFLTELADRVAEAARDTERRIQLFPESDLNEPRFVRPRDAGGHGHDAHWNDDFHHALHALLTGERDGYYEDYGSVADLARIIDEGYAFARRYSPHRRRRHGESGADLDGRHLIVAAQNHDQVGNRLMGERLTALVAFESLKLAAGAVILSPFIPLLFMGEEWGEPAPFLYFVSHGDPGLIEAVREGRRAEFASFQWTGEPPDPQSEKTFDRSRPDPSLAASGRHAALRELYGTLLSLRRESPALGTGPAGTRRSAVFEEQRSLVTHRREGGAEALIAMNFSSEPVEVVVDVEAADWQLRIDTAESRWLGPGTPPASLRVSGPGIAVSLPPCAFAAWTRGA
ncbi:MAG: malto-oligosyltrehalose trehalohydrolase [Thermoanaerobaculia bacterium]